MSSEEIQQYLKDYTAEQIALIEKLTLEEYIQLIIPYEYDMDYQCLFDIIVLDGGIYEDMDFSIPFEEISIDTLLEKIEPLDVSYDAPNKSWPISSGYTKLQSLNLRKRIIEKVRPHVIRLIEINYRAMHVATKLNYSDAKYQSLIHEFARASNIFEKNMTIKLSPIIPPPEPETPPKPSPNETYQEMIDRKFMYTP